MFIPCALNITLYYEGDINLVIEEGEYFVILGPTGAGKTLLLELLAGFYAPDGGRIWAGDRELTELPPEKRQMGFVYQDYMLFTHMNVEDNIGFGLNLKGYSNDEIKEKINMISGLIGITHLLRRNPIFCY